MSTHLRQACSRSCLGVPLQGKEITPPFSPPSRQCACSLPPNWATRPLIGSRGIFGNFSHLRPSGSSSCRIMQNPKLTPEEATSKMAGTPQARLYAPSNTASSSAYPQMTGCEALATRGCHDDACVAGAERQVAPSVSEEHATRPEVVHSDSQQRDTWIARPPPSPRTFSQPHTPTHTAGIRVTSHGEGYSPLLSPSSPRSREHPLLSAGFEMRQGVAAPRQGSYPCDPSRSACVPDDCSLGEDFVLQPPPKAKIKRVLSVENESSQSQPTIDPDQPNRPSFSLGTSDEVNGEGRHDNFLGSRRPNFEELKSPKRHKAVHLGCLPSPRNLAPGASKPADETSFPFPESTPLLQQQQSQQQQQRQQQTQLHHQQRYERQGPIASQQQQARMLQLQYQLPRGQDFEETSTSKPDFSYPVYRLQNQ